MLSLVDCVGNHGINGSRAAQCTFYRTAEIDQVIDYRRGRLIAWSAAPLLALALVQPPLTFWSPYPTLGCCEAPRRRHHGLRQRHRLHEPGLLHRTALALAGMIFAQSFRVTPQPMRALGSNLLGSLLGGFLELLSFVVGLSGLLHVAALLYLASFPLGSRDRA